MRFSWSTTVLVPPSGSMLVAGERSTGQGSMRRSSRPGSAVLLASSRAGTRSSALRGCGLGSESGVPVGQGRLACGPQDARSTPQSKSRVYICLAISSVGRLIEPVVGLDRSLAPREITVPWMETLEPISSRHTPCVEERRQRNAMESLGGFFVWPTRYLAARPRTTWA